MAPLTILRFQTNNVRPAANQYPLGEEVQSDRCDRELSSKKWQAAPAMKGVEPGYHPIPLHHPQNNHIFYGLTDNARSWGEIKYPSPGLTGQGWKIAPIYK